MRGRSILREPPGQSLCAFCAHRLGAARQPSHVQRRFLQSSRTSLKPPAEAAALREDDGDRGSDSNLRSIPSNGGNNVKPGLGPISSWGRPAFGSRIPGGPAAGWGRPSGGSSEILGGQISSQVSQSTTKPSFDFSDLSPHEQKARELMIENENRSQRRTVKATPLGPGPEATRSGRPIPFNEPDRLEMARSAVRRREAHEKADQRFNIRRSPRSTISGSRPAPRPVDPNEELPRWSMLRRRGDEAAQREDRFAASARDQARALLDRHAEERAQREEQAKSARYTPLSRRIESRAGSFGSTQTSQRIRSDFDRETVPFRNSAEVEKESVSYSSPQIKIRRPAFVSSFERGETGIQASERIVESRHTANDRNGIKMFTPQSSIPEQKVKFNPMASTSQPEEGFEKPKASFEKPQEPEEREERSDRRRKAGRFTEKATYDDAPKGKGKDKARRRQQFIEDAEEDGAEREAARQKAELRKQRKAEKAAKKAATPTPILLPEYISVSNLAVALKVRVDDFVEKMEELGFEETNHDYILNAENAGLIAMEYNFEAIIDKGDAEDLKARESAPDPSILPQRPPVVTIMGHVDHGKTTLLDWLRKSSVAATEHGGITQHIGAFSVPMPSGKIITFLDTPGHAAFLSMRQRGANVTDIVILVVAADDSVKPQTIEAIKHAQAAKVPIIVAINKIDKEESNVDRVKQDLARHGVDVEDFGGDTQVVCVSGKTGQGMDELEEAAITLSEILDMRAETDGQAEGWVLEASIKSMGKVATILVRRGTMRPGDFIVAGKTWARIRCLRNEAGVEIDEATPGTPVEIDGWREQPLAGDEVLQAPDESKAKSVVDYRLEKDERDKMALDMEAINENRKAEQEKREREKAEAAAAAEAQANNEEAPEKVREKPSGTKEIYFIVKGDVSGSVEAVIDSIAAIGNKEVRPHILRSGVGQLSEFDIEHAAAANGHVINFNTPVDPNIAQLAAHAKVSILDHNIIYRLVDEVKAELSKSLPPLVTQRVLGEAEIAEIFQITIKGRQQKPIAGSKIRNGTISKNGRVRVLRGGEKVFDGSLSSLKNVKKDVQEMKKGGECGIGFDGWFDFQVGDHVQSYEEISEKRYL